MTKLVDQVPLEIRQLPRYIPGKPINELSRQLGIDPHKIIKLTSNENPLGMSCFVHTAIQSAMAEAFLYPEAYDLIQALADFYGVDQRHVVIGNGSNDVLEMAARVFLRPQDEVVFSDYGFIVYQLASQAAGAKITRVPERNFKPDLARMLDAVTPATRIVWLANPNNPTGSHFSIPTITDFLDQMPPFVLVVLDEAYYEYLPLEKQLNAAKIIAQYPQVLITRTFSKAYGLAGLRIGYGLGSPEVIDLLNQVRQPFNANHFGLVGALAALKDQQFVQDSVLLNAEQRAVLCSSLEDLGCRCLPSEGNFICFCIKHIEQTSIVIESLLAEGIIVRGLSGYRLEQFIRVSVGLPEENQRFLEALERVIKHVN